MSCLKIFKRKKEERDLRSIKKLNKKHKDSFEKTPFKDRIVLAPRCMRNISVCSAQEQGPYFICKNCGGCTIGKIDALMKKLGYGSLYILKGGSAVPKIIKEQKPKALVGIACSVEGVPLFSAAEEENVIAQFVLLLKDGCANTDADIDEIEKLLKVSSENKNNS
ncbi:MAG: DUF116 domain-containing protein [Endomicrobium sp.]|jgi:hypothetical protein|nr:DUF116 domain-containing protein [Endomicrobium sp.]